MTLNTTLRQELAISPISEIDVARERAHNERAELAVAEFGDGLQYIREHYIAENRRDIRHAAEAAVRVGRRLIVMKACEGHGGWLDCLALQGIDPATASRMMMAARRLAALPNNAAAQNLIRATEGQAKLFELLSLPEDQFAELAETGQTNDLALEDIGKMTSRELRAAVREAREDLATKDERAAAREREIERLGKELRKAKRQQETATPDETAEDLRRHASSAALVVRSAIIAQGEDVSSLRTRAEALLSHGRETGIDQGVFLAGLFAEVERDLAALRADLGIEATVAADATPEWLKAAKAAGEV